MKNLIRYFLAVSMIIASSLTQAHHSFSATFTADRKSTVVGVVNKFSFKNPHVLIYIDVTNEDGSITEWVSEGAAATSMRRQGWGKDTITEGQTVRVSGDATHDGSPMTSIDYVEILNPETMAAVKRLGEGGERASAPASPAEKLALMPLTLDDGKPNLSAAWSNRALRTTRPGQFESISLSSKGQALQDIFDISTDPQVFCDPVGVIRQVITPHPARITQLSDRVIFEYEEFGGRREVFFDDRADKGIHTHYGDSIARYEGDQLIVETRNLLANQATNQGNRLTDQTTVTEIYTRADTEKNGSTLQLKIVISDPENLSEDIVHTLGYLDQGDYEFIENDCQSPLRERVAVHPSMNFFLTSVGLGNGADLDGLDGADAHCASLAANVGQGDKNWVAYLSTTGANSINARDRIGNNVWYNAKGEPIAVDTDDLHSDSNNLARMTVVTERGQLVGARGDDVNRHDILTGSQMDGTAMVSDTDTTCNNWTSIDEGSAIVGHFDRAGGGVNPTSWNYAHPSRGCSQEALQASGGDGLFYCFAK